MAEGAALKAQAAASRAGSSFNEARDSRLGIVFVSGSLLWGKVAEAARKT
jgi:hypothetical protein